MVVRLDIEGDIGYGANSADVLVPRIREAGNDSIMLRIDSAGGALMHAFRIADALAARDWPTFTIVGGRCASSAVLVALAGDDRAMVEGTCFELHAPHMGDCSDIEGMEAAELRLWADRLDAMADRFVATLVDRSDGGVNAATARRWLETERTIAADDAIHYGLVHGMADDVPRVSAQPRARFGAINSRHTSFRPVMAPTPLFAVGRHTYAAGTKVRHRGKSYMAMRDIAAIVVNAPGVGRGWLETT